MAYQQQQPPPFQQQSGYYYPPPPMQQPGGPVPPPGVFQQQQQLPTGMYQPQLQQQPPLPQGYGQLYGQLQQSQPPFFAPPPQLQPAASPSPSSGPFGFSIPVPQQQDAASLQREAELRSWFAAVDQKGTGRIDAESLRAALSSSGGAFKASTAERLIRMFDKDSTGSIEYNEFKAAHQFIQQMAAGFRSRDKDGSGVLEGPEVREALALSGYHLSQPAFDLLLRKFGRPRSSVPSIDFGSYIDLSILLGASARVFGFYDRNRSGLVTFDFNTFFVALLASTV